MLNPEEFKNINNHNLGIMSECPLCKSKVLELNIVEETPSGYLMHSKCKKCKNSVLLIAIAGEMGMNVIGMNTDLSMDEFIKIREYERTIEIDDVIDINRALEKKNFIKNLFDKN